MLGHAMMMASGASSAAVVAAGILDSLSVAPVGAFGLRRLRAAYTGPCVLVRRSSDNATQSISFDATGELDSTALLAFVGTGNGFIQTWYDQSTSAANAVQATAASQPMIVSAGAVTKLSAKPALKFYNGAISFLSATINQFSAGYALNSVVVNSGTQSYAAIADKSTTGGVAAPWMLFGQTNVWKYWYVGNGSNQNYLAPTGASNTPAVITHQVLASTQAGTFFYNGTANKSGTFSGYADSTNPITIGKRGDAVTWLDGLLPELVLFSAPLSDADRLLLERNQGQRFGITVA